MDPDAERPREAVGIHPHYDFNVGFNTCLHRAQVKSRPRLLSQASFGDSILYRDAASPDCRLPGDREGDWIIVGVDLFALSEETQAKVLVVLIC